MRVSAGVEANAYHVNLRREGHSDIVTGGAGEGRDDEGVTEKQMQVLRLPALRYGRSG